MFRLDFISLLSLLRQVVVSPSLKMSNQLNIEIIENFYDAVKSQQLLDELLKYEFENLQMNFNGKSYTPQRKVLAFGDDGVNYAFSGTCVFSKPWTATLLAVKKDVETKTGQQYNYALLNYYPNGSAKIGGHKDDEQCLDPTSAIPTLSLGATRSIQFSYPKFQSHTVQLTSGSLLLMKPPTNRFWSHAIPAEPTVKEPRISITFRNIVERPQDIVEYPRKRPLDDDVIPDDDWLTKLYAPAKKSNVCHKEWDLGYGFSVFLHEYDSRLFIHLQQYSAQATQKIVMNIQTFTDFQKKIFHVDTKYATTSTICNNQLLILSHKGELVLKQLFQFQLRENFLIVDYNNLIKIRDLIPEICEMIKESLINMLQRKILAESVKNINVPHHINLYNEFISALRSEIESNVLKLFRCEGCVIDDFSQGNHACITASIQDQSCYVGDDAILALNITNVTETLKSKNIIQFYNEDFFKFISYDSLKDDLKL